MAITFVVLIVVMGMLTAWRPLPAPVRFDVQPAVDLTPSPLARYFGAAVVVLTVVLYVVFW